uniref:Uncharacterized protein n=1 Tax=Chromera velia CCMP2878 TaxID=1169474 RepID=A0A0G4HM84_9ALVE|eukprot:Cvel_29011.t1-p1 / transcript=Cvel_29011.t1 / gene=Cvel_29011 / organism=Chromera_velia_CCMP2878 / gene_product=hypothetical protein / transcript_product=hypothetical protein / location=Cvel_scaffold3908:8496-9455(-) / protein_length=255 / sequence_SO=supercontig / SO=protein_coding / is_pseudo=false
MRGAVTAMQGIHANIKLFGKTNEEIHQYDTSQTYLAAQNHPKAGKAVETVFRMKEEGDASLKTSGATNDIADRTEALAIRQSLPKYYEVLWAAQISEDQYHNPTTLLNKCRDMVAKSQSNNFELVKHLRIDPLPPSNTRVTGEFSANYVGGTGAPPFSYKGRGGKGNNRGRGGGGDRGVHQSQGGSFSIDGMKCPDCGRRGGYDEGYDCPGQQNYCIICDALGKEGYHFEQCCPLGRERKNARGKARGRGGPPSM